MGNKTLIYQQKVNDNLEECYIHYERLSAAIKELESGFNFPIDEKEFEVIVSDVYKLALSDQIIYRFSKLQDAMGAKLFKAVLLFEGENVDKPFIDILNQLERTGVLDVDVWFELRDLRNEISHDYENDLKNSVEILNAIFRYKDIVKQILDRVKGLVK